MSFIIELKPGCYIARDKSGRKYLTAEVDGARRYSRWQDARCALRTSKRTKNCEEARILEVDKEGIVQLEEEKEAKNRRLGKAVLQRKEALQKEA